MDAGNWITLAAVVVAIIATVPAYVSLRFARAAADSAVAQTDLQRQIAHETRMPMLWADIRPHPEARSVMCLFVGNAGPTTAHDVRAVIEPRILPGDVTGHLRPAIVTPRPRRQGSRLRVVSLGIVWVRGLEDQ